MVSEVVRISRNREKPYSDRTHATATTTTTLYHGVRLVVKSKEEFYSDRTHATTTTTTTTPINSRRNLQDLQ